ncbi:hypothetical protein CKAN_00232800 [Cinnamomum micranthum f. kanehirae]|uniref:Uncharacterized protein n=1 Tax=Cinnamomum micranthum f. kanehirae TaxID=337451 RepID=A0A3S3M6B4_9MAGN|nr:hypothetical protein CKAN_00232800 [Cinnamomum micranthum f. kanehirae]
MGTPNHMLSRDEFHPQCETNPPTATCARMSTCGTQDCNTNPRPLVRSKNPSGRILSRSVSMDEWHCRDQRKWCPLCSRPSAISFNCGTEKEPMLPKHKKTTDECGCWSSHSINWLVSGSCDLLSSASRAIGSISIGLKFGRNQYKKEEIILSGT